MAVLALGALGAGIGYAAFGTQLALSAGWLIGSTLGNSMFGAKLPTQQGPRLNDLSVQASAYGQALPRLYGYNRAAGNVIWATPIVEASTTTTSGGGGKGGGGSQQTTVTYTYSVSFAVAFSSTQITGIRRIWADGTLLFDAGSGLSTLAPSINSIASTVVYPGSSSQSADPTIQAAQGAGNTPAFRNTAYIVFSGMQLANFGNRIPNISVEVTPPAPSGYDTFVKTYTSGVSSDFSLAFLTPFVFAYDSTTGFVTVSIAQFTAFAALLYKGVYNLSGVRQGAFINGSALPVPGGGFSNVSTPAQNIADMIIINQGKWWNCMLGTGSASSIGLTNPVTNGYMYLFKTSVNYVLAWYNPAQTTWNLTTFALGTDRPADAPGTTVTVTMFGGNAQEFWASFDGTYIWQSAPNGAGIGGACTLRKYDTSLNLLKSWTFTSHRTSGAQMTIYCLPENSPVGAPGSLYVGMNGSLGSKLWDLPAAGGAATLRSSPTIQTTFTDLFTNITPGILFGTTEVMSLTRSVPGTTSVSSILTDISTQCGLTAGDIDVTQITPTVTGFAIGSIMSGRDAIAYLQKGFFFDQIETGGKITWIPRGGASVVTLGDDDVAAYEQTPNEEGVDLLTMTHKQELDLPKTEIIQFPNYTTDYQSGSQPATRVITRASNIVNETLPIVMTDAQAYAVAYTLLYMAWVGRDSGLLLTSRKFLYLDPADVIVYTSTATGLTYTFRILESTYNPPGGLMQLNVVVEDSTIYTASGSGSTAPLVTQTVPTIGITKLAIMDLPIMQDDDNDAGWYISMSGSYTDWKSATSFQSIDAGVSYRADDFFAKTAIMGLSTTALGAFGAARNCFDLEHKLTVQLDRADMTLASVTDLQLLNGANSACLGNEVIQFATAVLNGDGTYTVSRLLRNRKNSDGTQGATVHTVGERFIVLNSGSSLRAARDTSYIGRSVMVKPVTTGATVAATSATTFVAAGNALKPFSPAQVGGGRDVIGNLTINWIRCNRLSGEWRNLVDVPQSEDTLQFSIDILSAPGGAVKRTINVTDVQTVQYSAADQVTDFGSTQSSIAIAIYQISSQVGRGFASVASI